MRHIYYLLFFTLFLTGCSEDDEFVGKDFKLGFDRTVSLGNGASFVFTTDSDLPVLISEFQIDAPNLTNDIDNILLNGSTFTTGTIGNSFQLTLRPQNEGYNNMTFVLDNTVSKKFINFQFLVESGGITFASVSYTVASGERNIVTNYEDSIFTFDYFTIRDVIVFIENGTPEGNELYTARARSNELSFSTSGGGTDVFRFFVEDL